MDENEQSPGIAAEPRRFNRRTLFGAAGAAAVVGGAAGIGGGAVLFGKTSGPDLWRRPDRAGAPRVGGLHLQFGSDAATEAVVSWHTGVPVDNPRVLLGSPNGGFGQVFQARTVTYRDGKSQREIRVNHARITGLTPDTDYVYAAVHDGTTPELGTLRTAPRGRAAFRFTSFGDQATPTLTKQVNGTFTNDNRGTPAAGDITAGIEQFAPLFNLINGDLCYADLATDRVRTWSDWFDSNSRSARYRPWMPAPGNHENELGNGPIGFGAYQAYFALPDSGSDPETRGLWYSFTAGAVRVISLANDDICLQDGGNSYVHGYSGGAQKRWLEAELAKARADRGIDWVVVCMHQTAFSTSRTGNGADLGIRQEWLPLFDKYGVDLVVCGHEHHYERAHAVRGVLGTETLTPAPVSSSDEIDTSKGTVHLVIGGGGTSTPSNQTLYDTPRARVLMSVGAYDPAIRRKAQNYVEEDAPWSAFRDRVDPYGFVVFDVDPGQRGGRTTMKATYYALTGPADDPTPVDRFTLTRPRTD
ncbi:purple acid phosphatase family protein [Nocardia sp. JCM 34519.1]|uniref:purple acid phosphatase family protein n=1 Tax=unclassified Nocardia TaxID=2637762 RepID=UPI0035A97AF1